MTDIKVQHVLTLVHLLSKGARYNFVPVTTLELGRAISKSQQAASKHLVELDKNGFIERISDGRNYSIRITTKGYGEMTKLYKILEKSIGSGAAGGGGYPTILLKGHLVSGMGEGAYYMSLKGYTKQFKLKIGYTPFPGTLNIKLDKRQYIETIKQFEAFEGIKINGFSDGKRTYGWVKCFAGKINSIDCHFIRLERTHHDPSVIELISKHNIRKLAKLADNSKVVIKIPV